MKALNEKEILQAYMKFAVNMLILIALSLFFFFSFYKTSDAEICEIKQKSGDSEKIFRIQMELSDDIDEFFSRYRAFDVKEDVNAELLMSSVVDKKMEILKKIESLPSEDVRIHMFVMSKMDELLRVRDSISSIKKEENIVKEDLFMCNRDYKKLNKQRRNSQFFK